MNKLVGIVFKGSFIPLGQVGKKERQEGSLQITRRWIVMAVAMGALVAPPLLNLPGPLLSWCLFPPFQVP